MANDIILSLQITAVGMGLVFGAIVVLWGLMTLLTAIIKEKSPEAGQPAPVPASDDGLKARAAAVAVALALAEQETSTAHPLPPPPRCPRNLPEQTPHFRRTASPRILQVRPLPVGRLSPLAPPCAGGASRGR